MERRRGTDDRDQPRGGQHNADLSGSVVSLRLNVIATQIANHAMFPLELALVVPFIRLGSRVFRTSAMPLAPRLFLQMARSAPLTLTRQIWMWEWHAFVLWAAIALVAAPPIALALTPLLRRVHERIRRHQYPIVTTHL